MPRSTRALLALAAGAACGLFAWQSLRMSGELAGDLTWPLRAARILLAGGDPYREIVPSGEYPFNSYFKYPLPAALLAMPLLALPPGVAAGLFVGASVAALSWALTTNGTARLPILLSGCVLSAVRSAQWTPILVAAFLSSRWGPALAVVKPNIGAAMFAAKPNIRAAALGVALVLASVAVLPHWIEGWWLVMAAHAEGYYRVPVLGGPGRLALAAVLATMLALRWRDWEVRLIVALACVPQVPSLYDQLPALLVARSRVEALALSLASLAGLIWWVRAGQDPYALGWLPLAFVYFPAISVVARRAWMDRARSP